MRTLFAALVALLIAVNAHAACNTAPTITFNGYVSGSSGTITPGQSTLLGWHVVNNDTAGCAAQAFSYSTFVLSNTNYPGSPPTNYITMTPQPPGKTLTLQAAGGSNTADIITTFQTKPDLSPNTCYIDSGQTPPFKYKVEFLVQTVCATHGNNCTVTQYINFAFVNVLDFFGNTCKR